MERDYGKLLAEAYKPDEEHVPSFKEEYRRAKALVGSVGHHLSISRSSVEAAIRAAWCELHPGIVGSRVGEFGVAEFCGHLRHALRDADALIASVVEQHIPKLKTVADPIDGVSSRNDPVEILKYVQRDRSFRLAAESRDVRNEYPFAMAWSNRAMMEPRESFRKIGLASLYMTHEAIDPQKFVEHDTGILTDLIEERLFHIDVPEVLVSFVKITEHGHGTEEVVHPDFAIQYGTPTFGPIPAGCEIVSQLFTCRTVRDNERGTTFLVSTVFHPKTLQATVVKGMRGRPVKDRRRCRHTIIGVKKGAVCFAPTAEDMERYEEIVRERFWHDEMCIVPDDSGSNPDSHPRVRSELRKIMGRYVRNSHRNGGLGVAPSVEHQMLPLSLHLFTVHGTNGSGHDKYRARNVARLVEDLFGEQIRTAVVPVSLD